MLVLKIRP